MESIEVIIDSGISVDDDIVNKLTTNIDGGIIKPKKEGIFCRVSTLQNGNSFLHCILKVLNREYNTSDVDDRLKMAKKFRKTLRKEGDDPKLEGDDELSHRHYAKLISELLKINIAIYTFEDDVLKLYKFYEPPEEEEITFCLLKNLHNCYEPIGYLTNDKLFFNFLILIK